ncbi:MAG: hypothetical protein M1820_008603 [Bogoriella megaspora]|nr:MAG: hypothetical protein M1820_008603 [Bogoriella megaspora]
MSYGISSAASSGYLSGQLNGKATIAFKRRIKFTVDGNIAAFDARSMVADVAIKLRLIGFVKNGKNGKVEGEAQGDEDKLNDFISHVKSGLPSGEVAAVEASEIAGQYVKLRDEYKNKFFGGGFKVL